MSGEPHDWIPEGANNAWRCIKCQIVVHAGLPPSPNRVVSVWDSEIERPTRYKNCADVIVGRVMDS
jgi:hypothetical protein